MTEKLAGDSLVIGPALKAMSLGSKKRASVKVALFFIFHSEKSVFGLYTQIFTDIVKTTYRITSCNYGKFTR